MLFFIGYLATSMILISSIRKNEHSNTGLFLLGIFTFMSGLLLSFTLGSVLRFNNGMELVGIATGGTAIAFFGLAAYTKTTSRDLSKMGTFLFIASIGFLVFAFANTFLQSSAMSNALAAFGCVFFTLFLSFDLYQLQRNPEYYGGPISATLEVFLSVIGLFSNLLRVLGLLGGEE
jgi:FtsH-binding integral membrane protein